MLHRVFAIRSWPDQQEFIWKPCMLAGADPGDSIGLLRDDPARRAVLEYCQALALKSAEGPSRLKAASAIHGASKAPLRFGGSADFQI
jgi:hypothetical protein